MNKFFLVLFLIVLLPQSLFAESEMNHSGEHSQILHAFTLEGDGGEARDGRSHAVDFSGWIGGDFDRIWLRSEQKTFGNYDKKSEVQALYSRNISQFWDAQIGLRHDFRTDFSSQNVNYLTLGLEGLAPYFFETVAQIFMSDQGNFSARLKREGDILITQKLILQHYFELEFFTQNVPELEVKSGLAEFEAGILTRYEITRKFAPYFGLRYHAKTFGTADLARQHNEKVDNFIISGGVRLRF